MAEKVKITIDERRDHLHTPAGTIAPGEVVEVEKAFYDRCVETGEPVLLAPSDSKTDTPAKDASKTNTAARKSSKKKVAGKRKPPIVAD